MSNQNISRLPRKSFREDIEIILNDLHSGKREVIETAVQKLRSIDQASIYDELRPFLAHRDPKLRCDALELLMYVDPLVNVEFILPLMEDQEEGVRQCICEELLFHKYYDKRVVDPLINILLHDTSSNIRFLAAILLGNIGDSRATQPLKWAQANDFEKDYEDETVSSAASKALKNMGYKQDS